MASNAPPPTIFAPSRRRAARARMRALQASGEAPRYVIEDMIEDVTDRLAFLRVEPRRALVIGDWTGALAHDLGAAEVTRADPVPGPGEVQIDEERPFPFGQFDFIASLGTLDTVNDLPGALIHLRGALAPGGLLVANFVAAGSLPVLREAMRAADGERPAPRVHPLVDVRAGGQLLQRAGFANPVVDARNLTVRVSAMKTLVADLRAQALGNVLARSGGALNRSQLTVAREAFLAEAVDGRVSEKLELLTLSGWKS